MARVLIAGVPRSGTTWLARALGADASVSLVLEPDNQWNSPLALRAKRGVPGRVHPVLPPRTEAPALEALWHRSTESRPEPRRSRIGALPDRVVRSAFLRIPEARRRRALEADRLPVWASVSAAFTTPARSQGTSAHTVIKSVYASLYLDWIVERTGVTPLIIYRDPLNVISSWAQLGWLDADPDRDLLSEIDVNSLRLLARDVGMPVPSASAPPVTRATYLFGLLSRGLRTAASRHPQWPTASHESLCGAPSERLRELASQTGLPWTHASERAVESMNRPGERNSTHRVSEEQTEIWRERLSPAQVDEIRSVLDAMKLSDLCAPSTQ